MSTVFFKKIYFFEKGRFSEKKGVNFDFFGKKSSFLPVTTGLVDKLLG